ncbi:MAG: Protein TolB [candidate division TM6 bacterium GW2011_GWF2_36_6]|nr:MAG: Protein TolB [candidate division TM6 bacterium GW2011_GWF2_36_6]
MHNFCKKMVFILLVLSFNQNASCADSQTVKTASVSTSSVSTTSTSTASINSKKSDEISVQVSANSSAHSKIKTLMLCVGKDESLTTLAKIIKFDLEFTDQLDVELKKTEEEPDKKVLSKLFKDGVSLFICLKNNDVLNKYRIEVVLKEPSSGVVLFNKAFAYSHENLVLDAHTISDKLLPALTGEKGPMLSTLAYAICIADYECRQERILYSSKMMNVAPRWHTQAPMIFFSQLTKENNRLMSLDLNSNKTRIISSYEGLNMQPSFSEDGSKSVLCLSGRKNSELYLYDQALCNKYKKKVFIQLTHNEGNNASPCFLPNGDVIFCSDYQTGKPQIYYLNSKTKQTKRLTNGKGYCAAPSYCKRNNSIVYCRSKKGFFQLYTINLNNKFFVERALTTDQHSKQEPVWSECGNYITFSTDCFNLKTGKNVSQIAVLNVRSGKIRVLTSDDKFKNFPCWTNKTYYC